jgi:hypothetical protein
MNVDFIGFPEEEPTYFCRLVFKKYARSRPMEPASYQTEAVYRLPIPSSLTDQFGMDISDPKFDILGNSITGIKTAGSSRIEQFKNDFDNGNLLEAVLKLGGDAVALVPGISDSRWGKLAQAEKGVVRNPHHTMIFDGVQLKSYSFTWKMSPRSQQEAITLEKIITNIKAYMHPTLSASGFSLEYPSLAELQFLVGDNKLVPNVKTSFIKNLTVNGSGGGVPSFYRDGKSTIVEIGMTFQELNIQTREDFMPNSQQNQTG